MFLQLLTLVVLSLVSSFTLAAIVNQKDERTRVIVKGIKCSYSMKMNHTDADKQEKLMQIEKLKSEKMKLESKVSSMSKQVDDLNQQLDKMNASNFQLQKENQRLRGKLNPAFNITFESTAKLFTDAETWEEARKLCKKKGMDLAVIQSKEESEWMSGELSKLKHKINDAKYNDQAWIGLSRTEDYKWLTVSEETWTSDNHYWAPKQPDYQNGQEKCVTILEAKGMNDAPCDFKFAFFCRMNQ